MSKNTREQIIDYSADLLRARGYSGFSFLDIAREFDIKKASVHHHFPKKVDLGLALCDWTQQWLEQGLAHFEAKGSSQWNKLERYLKAAQKHTLNEQLMCPISAFHNDLPVLDDAIKDRLKTLGEIELAWVTQVISTGIESEEFAPRDAEAMASLFVFSCKGALYHARLHGKNMFNQTMKQFENIIKRS
jgi:TetR/AcrR family transcriptional regulator, transcriptional repressor for nem operon